jgi:CRP/FNR family cyclic AMP-dependent transcriptional regulator
VDVDEAWRRNGFRALIPLVLSTVEKVLFLKSIDLFSQIPGAELTQVAVIATEEAREAGEEIFGYGERGDALYLILEGELRVHREEKVIAQLGVRECFGEMALLDAEPRSASVTTVRPSRLLKIGREEFQELLSDRPEIALGVIQVLTKRLRNVIR